MQSWGLIFFLLIHLLALPTVGQQRSENTLFDFSIRYRYESWDGMNAKNYGNENGPGKLNDNILYQRIIMGIRHYPTKSIEMGLHLQDARAFGWSLRNRLNPNIFKNKAEGTSTPYYRMNPGEEFIEIHDAYINWKFKSKPFQLKVGRQKIAFGDYHIFGPGDWGNAGRWNWDAIKMSAKKELHTTDLFFGGTKTHDPNKLNIPFSETEFWGGGIYLHLEWEKLPVFEPFYAIKSPGSAPYARTANFNRNWLGLRLLYDKIAPFIADFTYVYQLGNEAGIKTNAVGVFGKIGFETQLPFKALFSARYTYASGKNSKNQNRTNFDPVYGAGDKFYGWMNLMKWSNISNPEIVLEFWPLKEMWIEIKHNRFYIPSTENYSLLQNLKLLEGENHLGDEINLFIKYEIHYHFQITAAGGYFWPGKLQPINGNAPNNAQWLAIQCFYKL